MMDPREFFWEKMTALYGALWLGNTIF